MTILARVLLLLTAMGATHVLGSITKCDPRCGTQDSYEYIDYCDGEDDIVSRMKGENSMYCQDLSITDDECELVGSFNPSNKEPLPVVNAPGGRIYTVDFTNINSADPKQPDCYKAKEFCVANVQCGPGEVAQYTIIDHDIEGESSEAENYPKTTFWCNDLRDENQCLDYLNISTVYNDNYCTCGRVGISGQTLASLRIPREGIGNNWITLTQRSNSNCGGKGSLITVQCLLPPTLEIGGACKPTFVGPQLPKYRTRFRIRQLTTYRLSRRWYTRQFTRIIRLGKGFTFTRGIIRDSRSRAILYRGVTYLVRVNRLLRKTRTVYRRTAPGSFHGYGRLIVAIRRRPRYQKDAFFIGDEFPPEYQLSRDDKIVVNALLTRIAWQQAARAAFKRNNRKRGRFTFSRFISGILRYRARNFNLRRLNYVRLSQKNMDSCKPIVRLAASAYAKVFRVTTRPRAPARRQGGRRGSG